MLSPEEAYKYDHTFRTVVDLMRIELTKYDITPAELRQAAILAATMHESERIRPLFTNFTEHDKQYGKGTTKFGGMEYIRDEMAKSSAATFPDEFVCICDCRTTTSELHSATCKDYNWQPLHQLDMPKLDGRAVTERRIEDRRKSSSTGYKGPYRRDDAYHSRERRKVVNKKSPSGVMNMDIKYPVMYGSTHCHTFFTSGYGYNVCACGISDVYYSSSACHGDKSNGTN